MALSRYMLAAHLLLINLISAKPWNIRHTWACFPVDISGTRQIYEEIVC